MSNVSVIIPTWNRADIIERAIRSALDQTVSPLEVLVCDDGSTDNTLQVVKSINDPRIKWISGPHTGLPAVPRNKGISHSKGGWIAFLDSDDEWLPEKLEEQLNIADKLNCKAASTNALRLIPGKGLADNLLLYDNDRITFEDLLAGNQIICSSALVNRSLFDEIKGFPENMALKAIEDYALWLRVGTLTDFAYTNKPLIIYSDNPENSIREKGDSIYIQQLRVFSDFLQWGKSLNVSPQQLKMIRNKYYATWFNNIKKKLLSFFKPSDLNIIN